MNTLRQLLLNFLDGPDRSIEAAKIIEAEILRLNLDEDPRFEDLVDGLASYQPGGGEYLYDELYILKLMKKVLKTVPSN